MSTSRPQVQNSTDAVEFFGELPDGTRVIMLINPTAPSQHEFHHLPAGAGTWCVGLPAGKYFYEYDDTAKTFTIEGAPVAEIDPALYNFAIAEYPLGDSKLTILEVTPR